MSLSAEVSSISNYIKQFSPTAMLSASLGCSGKLPSKLFKTLASQHFYVYCLASCTDKLYDLAQQ